MDAQFEPTGFYTADSCDIAAFKELLDRTLKPQHVPQASAIDANIPLYNAAELEESLADDELRRTLMAEWARVFNDLSGVLVIRGAYADTGVIDRATKVYNQLIAAASEKGGGGADHFAAAGTNQRIWNSLQKLCLAAPDVFLEYFANPVIEAVCESWLGPGYQMTSQVNLVHPGGAAQQAHRDYHLGFQSAEACAQFPAHMHELSPLMTLQGAVAHVDMPVESGPTKLLPFSQSYQPGYAAFRLQEFKDLFEERSVQLPLKKGDAIFFNPALFHAAGANTSADVPRMANLLQISSAFGRAMESVDRLAMCQAIFPVMVTALREKQLTFGQLNAAASACAEGYSFPTNLDTDPPIGGMVPETQKDILLKAVRSNLTLEEFEAALHQNRKRRQA